MKRGGRGQRPLPGGWDYTPAGIAAWDEQVEKFEDALLHSVIAKTIARGSKSIDGPECQESGHSLLVGAPTPKWKTTLRVCASIGLLLAGGLVSQALTPEQSNREIALWLISGVSVATLALLIREIMLRR